MNILQIFEPLTSAQLLVAAFIAILFLQSGIDKIIDRKGNLAWLEGHFGKSPLKNMVPLLLSVITVFEVAAGIVSAVGAGQILFSGQTAIALAGAQLAALSLVMLFFGQRISKDYAGAAILVPYFILAIGAVLLFSLPGN
ncbi:MAG: DoxX family protein [Bacteroidia bacterium]|nr:DoxX family protein [Bacteroidia bacterium]